MVTVQCWTGAETKALRQAMRLSIRAFAAHLGIDARTVNKWEARRGTITLRPDTQALMDTTLERAPEEVKTRFTQTVDSAKQEQRGNAAQCDALAPVLRTEPAPDVGPALLARPPEHDGTDSFSTESAHHPPTRATGVNRRELLLLAPGIAGGYPFTMGTVTEEAPSLDSLDVDPVEHFKRMKNMLMDNDNAFGANSVILSVQEQIGNLRQLRQSYRGSTRQELLHIQVQFADLCGWLFQDSGDYHSAAYWTGRALEWSRMCNDQDSISFILARRSQLAADMGDPVEAVEAAEAALNMAPHASGRVVTIATTFAAQGHALRGDEANCERSYAMAHELIDRIETDPTCPWALMVDHSYIEVYRAHSLTALGEYGAAIESFQKAISRLPRGYRRDRGVYLAREATAHLGHGDAEQASTVGLQAVAIGAETRSARIIGELKRLDTTMRRFPSSASTASFHEAMHSAFPPSDFTRSPAAGRRED